MTTTIPCTHTLERAGNWKMGGGGVRVFVAANQGRSFSYIVFLKKFLFFVVNTAKAVSLSPIHFQKLSCPFFAWGSSFERGRGKGNHRSSRSDCTKLGAVIGLPPLRIDGVERGREEGLGVRWMALCLKNNLVLINKRFEQKNRMFCLNNMATLLGLTLWAEFPAFCERDVRERQRPIRIWHSTRQFDYNDRQRRQRRPQS